MNIALLRMHVRGPGGAEATLQHVARGLAAAGHRVTVYGAGADPQGAGTLGPQVKYQAVPVWGRNTAGLLSFAVNSRRLLLQNSPDVVFSLERTFFQHVYRAGDGCHREWLTRRTPSLTLGRKLAQNLSPFHKVMLWLEKGLFASPELKRVIANSRQVKAEIIRHYRVDPGTIRVVYNGLDRQVFRPADQAERLHLRRRLGMQEDDRLLLFVGSGFVRKGLPYLLEAFRCLKGKRAHLWVVGKDRLGRYEALAQQLGVAPGVRFWGPQPEVAPFYQAADLLALPTLYDPCSNAVLEALGCGCPVITTTANGAAEFITPGENGEVIANPGDIQAWVKFLDEWLARGQDPQAGRRAQDAVAHLSWDATISQTLEVLAEAAAAS